MPVFVAVILGALAWIGVIALSVLIAFNMGDKNQVLMFLPIIAAVIAAWAIGDLVTERVFGSGDARRR